MPGDRNRAIEIAYFAPGSGLGHLNRALAVCQCLREECGVANVEVLTNSPYAEGVAAQLRAGRVVRLRGSWTVSARAYIAEFRPRLVVTDTFPYGFQEELRGVANLVHIARRLQAPFPMEPDSLQLSILAEPLSQEHEAALRTAGPCLALQGPIVMPPVAPSLDVRGLALVVHSGPEDEVRLLEFSAEQPYRLISPRFGLECYPVSGLFADARHIVTAAGYNLMAELLPYRAKHTAIAMPRRFDDQQARLQCFFGPEAPSGTLQAATAIATLLGTA